GRVYGTLVVDLAQHRPIDLLPDRSAETLASWLREHPGVEVIARDRAQDYARGASEGAPDALQVADRFHLLGNGREVLERYVQRVAPALRRVLAPEPTAKLLTPPQPEPSVRPLPRYGRSHQLQQLQEVLLPDVVDNSDRPLQSGSRAFLHASGTLPRSQVAYTACCGLNLVLGSAHLPLISPRLSLLQAALAGVARSRDSAPSSGGWPAPPPWSAAAAGRARAHGFPP